MALVNHDYPFDGELKAVEESGEPIEGVIVRIYDHTAFFAGEIDTWVGETTTDLNGEWLDHIQVDDGQSWVVWMEKPTMYGPRHVEITT